MNAGQANDALSLIARDSTYGALLLIAIVGLGILFRQLLKVQDLRIKDLYALNKRFDADVSARNAVSNQMVSSLSELRGSLELVHHSNEDLQRAANAHTAAIDVLQRTVDSVIRDAVRGIHAGGYQVTKPSDTLPGKGG
jgi:hypothetical protein